MWMMWMMWMKTRHGKGRAASRIRWIGLEPNPNPFLRCGPPEGGRGDAIAAT